MEDYKFIEVPVEQKYKCCDCGWIGTHSQSGDKTLVAGTNMWLLVCPECGNDGRYVKVD